MDNADQSFAIVTEDFTKKTQFASYLNELKNRLAQLREQQNEVILKSLSVIKEIDQVSSSVNKSDDNFSKHGSIARIKAIIQNFENASNTKLPIPKKSTNMDIDSSIDIRKTLRNFEILSKSHVLTESLLLFKRAKDTFEKIDKVFGNMTFDCITCTSTGSVRDKVNLFNSAIDSNKGSHSGFASCCSSLSSIKTFNSAEEFKDIKSLRSTNISLERGYEGDNDDSDYNLTTTNMNTIMDI